MGEEHFLNLQPGTIVNGRYEIIKCLGTGSMGMVYACRHRELSGHLVAMKVLFTEVARDEVAAARFRNEIVASYGVSHPNVVRAYEYFRDGDLVAFTMEYIGGGDLADKLNAGEPLEIEQVLHYLKQMCAGVQAIHDAGIIHRDLKPENILLTTQGDIKITDFGIARTGTGPKLTEHGGVVGTIDYVSPEYLERGQVDTRSDIYALGVLAYEMITGETPFQGKSVIETMTLRLRTDPEVPIKIRHDCPEELSRIVMKTLRRNPDERYQSAAELQKALETVDPNRLYIEEGDLIDSYGDDIGIHRLWNEERPTRNIERPNIDEFPDHVSPSKKRGSRIIDSESQDDDFDDLVTTSFNDDNYNSDWKEDVTQGTYAKEIPISISQSRINIERLKNLSRNSSNIPGNISALSKAWKWMVPVFFGLLTGIVVYFIGTLYFNFGENTLLRSYYFHKD